MNWTSFLIGFIVGSLWMVLWYTINSLFRG